MKIRALNVAVLLLFGFGLPVATPTAHAEAPSMNGVYLYLDEDGDVGRWTITTSCTPDCVAHVTTSPGRGFDAPLVDGRYISTRTIHDGATCPGFHYGDYGAYMEASTHPVTVQQWWDPVTLHGEVDYVDSTAWCGLAEAGEPFTLTKLS